VCRELHNPSSIALPKPSQPQVGVVVVRACRQPFCRWPPLAFGYGLRPNLGEAYTYLMPNYQHGDKLFAFGFSRGAYTVRALAGLLKAAGLLRAGSENLVPYAVSVYARNKEWSDDDWTQLHRFAGAFSRLADGRTGVPVEFMGVWDSVKAAGILRWEPALALHPADPQRPDGAPCRLHRRETPALPRVPDRATVQAVGSCGR